MNFDQVLPEIFVGSCPMSVDDIDTLREEISITGVLSLQTDEDLEYLGIDWPCLAAHYRSAGIEVRRLPVRDFDEDDLCRNLPACVNALEELLRNGRTVYVHCNVGMNRSPTTVIAYLAWRLNWDVETAVEHMIRCRWCLPSVRAVHGAKLDGEHA